MPFPGGVLKRLLVGRALRSDRLGETLLPKRIALPVFASDALSSVAYAPDEIFLTLSAAGFAAYAFSWKIAIAVAVVMVTVVASYRQTVRAYPNGGGDYEVTSHNLGATVGLVVASALMVDYVLTVAVSISSGADYAASAIPLLKGHTAALAVGLVVVLMAMNLRGIRESGTAFAIPTYAYMIGVLGMALVGFVRAALGTLPQAETARIPVPPSTEFPHGLTGLLGAFLILKAFSSGSAALTGVEAISNGVPNFREPKSKNAATTLLLLGTIAVTMMFSVVVLARITDVHRFAARQDPIISQLAKAAFSGFSPGFYFVATATGVVLVMAANTAFNGFPVLGSILAKHGYLPRQLQNRGDRLAFSNGIILLAGFAVLLIVVFDAQTTRLIQLYIVGVFVSFTASQIGMVRHWNRHLRTVTDAAERRRMIRSRAINAFGATMTGIVLFVVLVTKFLAGAWISVAAMSVIFLTMRGIRGHYDAVSRELFANLDAETALPARVHAIVLLSKLHKPALRALAYARATRPSVLEAVIVDVDPEETAALVQEWEQRGIPVPLKVLASPYREITRPIVEYLRSIRRRSPRDVITVFIPEYIVGRWWEQLLHNQTALRLKGRLLFTPGVMVVSVPYQLKSSERLTAQLEDAATWWHTATASPTDLPADGRPPVELPTRPGPPES
ncbi:amino acid/polyamine/organocation transporter, APC superfamily [Acidothermus cellulolyticus 11B]|uniref:Amino acid/polyamine/organocation transporter, APC superfamily n=1 Tax=Acidothermus cellulolyticus (strain ATCC 43068 / DSM 8971 / 11B) TaxID=351607 RepID=A0LUQ9_ACIC1|nr:APC family permease [Acidothermus cellulolyticus]ABK53169.1 amino acid/polyamine/organocation transporter, APC superfamily [Acidothermus cellulolyticus 11B]